MKVLCHQLILVAVLITGQADAVSEITRRDEEQVPLSGQMKAYPELNLNTEAQLSAETEKASVEKVLNLKAPNGFSFDDSNEAGESFETEANVVTENDGRDQVNGANTLDEHNFLPPSRGNDYKNELMTTAHASASADFETGDKTKNRAVVKNDAANQSELQAQFRQEAQYGAESQAETVIPENQETFKNLPPAQEMMQLPYETSPLARPPVNKGDVKNTLKANPIIGASSEPLNKPGRETGSWYARLPNKVPYGLSKPIYTYGSPFIVTTPPADRATNPSIAYTEPVNKHVPFHQVSKTGIKKYKPMANGYEATRIPNWVPHQKGNPTKSLVANDVAGSKHINWNPYKPTYKPIIDETLIQAIAEEKKLQVQTRAETVADLAAEENGNQNPNLIPYQKKNLFKPIVPIDILQNGYNNNENWNPYTKPAEGETLVQAEGKIQGNGDQSPNLIQYQKENPNTPNVFQNGYNTNKNWSPYTKPTEGETLVQREEEIQSNGEGEANLAAPENGNRNPILLQYQKENPNKPFVPISIYQNVYNNNNWNPYTKPAEGETLVQAEGKNHYNEKTVTDLAAQENGDRSPELIPNQVENINKPLVPINVFQNGYYNNKNWNPYTKPTEGETLVQMEEEIQSNGKAEANLAAQENGNRNPNLLQYQKENPNKPLVPINIIQSGYNNNNWNPYTKPAEGETLVQAEGENHYTEKTVADLAAQENGDRSPELIPNQVENINKPLVPINDFQNGYNNNKKWNPYTKPTEGETLVQMEEEIQSNGKAETNLAAQENGNRNPNLLQYQKENPNKPLVPINIIQSGYNNNNWNPYTKPAEGETLVQAESENHYTEKTVADLAAQESDDRSPRLISNQKENINKPINVFQNGYNNNNNWNPYTKPTEGETLVQMEEEIQNNGKAETNIAAQENDNRDIVSLNGYNNNKNWNPYTKPAEGETLIQAGEIQSSQLNSGMQYKPSVQANIVAQSNGGFHYSEENKITSAAEVAAKAPANIASSYSGGLAATQMNGAQESRSSIYGNTNKYNNVYSNGPGNENSHLQNGAQFGAVKGVEPPGQAYPVIDARFGQTTHPVRRPLSAFGYKQPNGWNHW